MFFFKRKVPVPVDLSWIETDIHSHLIPGIDDGSRDMGTSLEMAKGLLDLGYKKVITTPHILWDIYPNTPESIQTGLNILKQSIENEGIKIQISAAAEYFMDDHLNELLENKIRLLTVSGNFLLVEFSMITPPLDLQDVLFELQIQNYQPIIAHPERYIYLTRKKEFYDELKNAGCFFQMNLLSLAGHYGNMVQELAEYLVKKNYYDFVGTDMHHLKHLSLLQSLKSTDFLERLKDSGTIKNINL